MIYCRQIPESRLKLNRLVNVVRLIKEEKSEVVNLENIMDWKTVKKIDAHVHLAPPETLEWIDGAWKQADLTIYLELMEKYHVEKALLVPINAGATYYRDCS